MTAFRGRMFFVIPAVIPEQHSGHKPLKSFISRIMRRLINKSFVMADRRLVLPDRWDRNRPEQFPL